MSAALLRASLLNCVLFLLGLLNACSSYDYLREARRINTTDSQFVVSKAGCQNSDTNVSPRTLLVFVHGIFGDTLDTWRNRNGTRFLNLISDNPEFCNTFDVFAFGFPTSALKTGSFNIPEAAAALRNELQSQRINEKYTRVVFVAHSMGGLVTLEFLMTDPSFADKVPLVVTFATPYEGTQAADLGKTVINNEALAGMVPIDDGNNFLVSFTNRWKLSKDEKRLVTKIQCAYEKVPIPVLNILVVPPTSASGLCDGISAPIAEDHLGIVKPDDFNHASYKFLTVALRALPPYDSAAARLKLATSAFEVYSHARLVDATEWKYVPEQDRDNKLSKVVWNDRLKVMRLREDQKKFVLRHATTASIPIDFRSNTHNHNLDIHETIEQPEGGLGKQIRIFDVNFDVSGQPLGQWFDVHLEATYWNAINNPENPWVGFPVQYKTNQADIEIRLPHNKPISRWERREGSRDTKTSDLVNDAAAHYSKDDNIIVWRIEQPLKNWVYKILWKW